MAEVTILWSNLIKSGFVAFSQDNALVIDSNQSKVIKSVDEKEKEETTPAQSLEEALAEEMINDILSDDFDDDEKDILTMRTSDLPLTEMGDVQELMKMSDEVLKSARSEAEDIIEQANIEAEQIRAKAYEEIEELKQQAKESGYEAGYQEGLTIADGELKQKQAELEEQKQMNEVKLQEKEEQLLITTEQKMVDLLCQLIPSITGVVIDNQKDVLLYMINNAIRDLESSKHFLIKVSTQDYEQIAERKEDIYGAQNPNIELEIF